MQGFKITQIVNEDIEYSNIQKENKIKVVNDLVKNYSILKELGLISLLKEQESYTNKNRKLEGVNETLLHQNDGENIILASKYLLNFLQLKKKEKEKKKEEEKKEKEKTKKEKEEEETKKKGIDPIKHGTLLKEINKITNILKKNELQLSDYKNRIINCGELFDFRKYNKKFKTDFIHSLENFSFENSNSEKLQEFFNNFIKNYNLSLHIIEIQQNLLDTFTFYIENLLLNNKLLIEKNKKLIKNSLTYKRENILKQQKNELENSNLYICKPLNNVSDVTNNEDNNGCNNEGNDTISYSFKSQIDVYRKHINYLYEENDNLKNTIHLLNEGDKITTT